MDSVDPYEANVSNEGFKEKIEVENTSISSIHKVACSDTIVVVHIGTDTLQALVEVSRDIIGILVPELHKSTIFW